MAASTVSNTTDTPMVVFHKPGGEKTVTPPVKTQSTQMFNFDSGKVGDGFESTKLSTPPVDPYAPVVQVQDAPPAEPAKKVEPRIMSKPSIDKSGRDPGVKQLTADEVNKNIKSDLTPGGPLKDCGEDYEINLAQFKNYTFAELRSRYGISEGVYKEALGLRMDEDGPDQYKRGKNIDLYAPEEFQNCSKTVKISKKEFGVYVDSTTQKESSEPMIKLNLITGAKK